MRRTLIPVCLVVALLAAPVLVPAAAAPPDPEAGGLSSSERLDALFARVKHQQSQLRSLEAEFVQHKTSELFVNQEEARGTFSFLAPDRVRWEFTEPNPMVVVIDEERMTTWYQDMGEVDVMRVGQYSEKVFKYMGASGSLDTLLDYFQVRVTFPEDGSEPYRMTLDPRYPRIAKRIEVMDLWIDREHYVPVRLRYVEPDGDSTEYRFRDVRVNPEISPERFELDLPPDLERRSPASDQPSP